jgi:hypothetical protein
MTLQATDASSSVATTTCSATVPQPAPTITSFVATPAAITAGQSSVLSWNVSNASTTSINNGLGVISSTSITVAPSVTTTYALSATNPGGTVTSAATVTVTGTTTSGGGTGGSTLAAQIQALLNQIKALQLQIAQLLIANANSGNSGGGGTATSTPSCFNFGRDLKHGDQGDDVKELQLSLAQTDPTLFPPGLASGFFGPKTEAALKMFQRRFGISSSSTGFFGQRSRDFFKNNCGKQKGEDNQNQNNNQQDPNENNNVHASSTVMFREIMHGSSTIPLGMPNHGGGDQGGHSDVSGHGGDQGGNHGGNN